MNISLLNQCGTYSYRARRKIMSTYENTTFMKGGNIVKLASFIFLQAIMNLGKELTMKAVFE